MKLARVAVAVLVVLLAGPQFASARDVDVRVGVKSHPDVRVVDGARAKSHRPRFPEFKDVRVRKGIATDRRARRVSTAVAPRSRSGLSRAARGSRGGGKAFDRRVRSKDRAIAKSSRVHRKSARAKHISPLKNSEFSLFRTG